MQDQAGPFHRTIRSPECVNAWKALVERPLTFAEFAELPMPDGCTAEELWRDFSMLRRCAGVTFHVKPWFRSALDVSWAFVPKETEHDLEEIAWLSGPSSLLSERLDVPTVSVGLSSFLAREVSATCHRDGFELSQEEVRALWLRQREPRCPEERAVLNLSSVFGEIGSFARRPFSLALLDRLHEEVTEGVGELERLRPNLIYGADVLWEERVSDRDFVERTVYDAVSHAKATSSITDIVVSFYELSAVMWDLRYYPSLNALTELAIRWTFFAKCGRPALSFVPFTALSRRRSNRYDRQFTAEFRHLTTRVGSETGLDCTLMFAGTVRTLRKGLEQVEAEAGKLVRLMEGAMEALQDDAGLNRRQRDFLAMLARNPRLAFKVKDYAEMFGVVRVTARSDLRGLVERGYLEERTVDRAAVFARARPDGAASAPAP